MASSARRRTAARSESKVAKKASGGLKLGVHVAACIERDLDKDRYGDYKSPEYPGRTELQYSTFLEKIYIDSASAKMKCRRCWTSARSFSAATLRRLAVQPDVFFQGSFQHFSLGCLPSYPVMLPSV